MLRWNSQLFQPKYTMHGFEWTDLRGTDGVGFVRVLRSLLTSHLPSLLLDIRSAISRGLEDELASHKVVDGKLSTMWLVGMLTCENKQV